MKGTQRRRDRTKAQKEGGERRKIPLSFWEVLPSFNPEDGAAFSFLALGGIAVLFSPCGCCCFLPLLLSVVRRSLVSCALGGAAVLFF